QADGIIDVDDRVDLRNALGRPFCERLRGAKILARFGAESGECLSPSQQMRVAFATAVHAAGMLLRSPKQCGGIRIACRIIESLGVYHQARVAWERGRDGGVNTQSVIGVHDGHLSSEKTPNAGSTTKFWKSASEADGIATEE